MLLNSKTPGRYPAVCSHQSSASQQRDVSSQARHVFNHVRRKYCQGNKDGLPGKQGLSSLPEAPRCKSVFDESLQKLGCDPKVAQGIDYQQNDRQCE